MTAVKQLITDHLDIWTSATKFKSSAGRGSSSKTELYGIKKLRELILDLAVRGLLVPQNPDDESASTIIKRISDTRTNLIKEGKLKKQKALPDISEREIPFILPNQWRWARLGEITNYGISEKADADQLDGNTWVVELEDIEKETSRIIQRKRLFERAFKSSKNKFIKGDVLYGKLRPYLDKVVIADEDGVCTTEIVPLHAYSDIKPEFLRLAMKSPAFVDYATNSTHGMNLPRMGTDKARLAVIPICSQNEQHRIVAKVDELMTLCDQLERQTEASNTAHQTLVETLLGALTNAPDHARFQQAWHRIAEHFDSLFNTENSIEQLEKALLRLAVMGRLSTKREEGGTASDLIAKNFAVQQRLFLEENLKTKASETVDEKEQYLAVPKHWRWIRLGNLAKFIDYRGRTPKKLDRGVRLITAKNVRFGYIDLQPEEFISEDEYKAWMTRGIPRPGDILFTPEAPLGNVAIVDINEEFALAQRAICFQLHLPEFADYLLAFIKSDPFQEKLKENATGMTATGIKSAKLKEIPIPIPPLAEQKAITSKLGELTRLANQLSVSISDRSVIQQSLADVISGEAIG